MVISKFLGNVYFIKGERYYEKGNFNQRAQRFSIHKYSIGVASVLIASVLFMGGEVVVAEDMVSADAMLQEQVTQSGDNQVVTNENTK